MKTLNKYSFQIAVASFISAIAFIILGVQAPAAIAMLAGGIATLITDR